MGSKTGGVSQSRNLYFAWGAFIRADLLFSNGLRGRSPPWGAERVRPCRQILGCDACRSAFRLASKLGEQRTGAT